MKNKKDLTIIFEVLSLIAHGSIFYFIWMFFISSYLIYPFYNNGNYLLVLIYVSIYFLFSKIYGGFRIGEYRIIELLYAAFLADLFTMMIIYGIVGLIERKFLPAKEYLVLFLLNYVFSAIISYIANRIYVKKYTAERTLIIGSKEDQDSLYLKLKTRPHLIDIRDKTDFIDYESSLENVISKLKNYNSVFVDIVDDVKRNAIISYAYTNNINIYLVPTLSSVLVKNSEFIHLFDVSIIKIESERNISFFTNIIKRAVDILLSLLGIIISLPILACVFIAIKIEDQGPFIYKQNRLTKNGKEFEVLKIRSMCINAESNGVAVLAKENDDRITKIGNIIRRFRLDEIPQLINILKGDMSFVGPRPERPEIYDQYELSLPNFKTRLKVKAGLSGYAQVFGKYNTPFKDKLMMDIEYINSYSILLDLKIMLMTVKILFMKESTEGQK